MDHDHFKRDVLFERYLNAMPVMIDRRILINSVEPRATMTEQQWLASTDPQAMLHYLTSDSRMTMLGPTVKEGIHVEHGRLVSDRKLRLFAAACYWDVLEAARGIASGLSGVICLTEQWAESGVKPKEYESESDDYHDLAINHARSAESWSHLHRGTRTLAELSGQQADLLRMIVGNPFRPMPKFQRCVKDESKLLGGNKTVPGHPDPTVLGLATAAYEERKWRVCGSCKGTGCTFPGLILNSGGFDYTCNACHGSGRIEDGQLCPDRLGVLADAAEDAGCEDEVLLRALRGEEVCGRCEGKGWMRTGYEMTKGDGEIMLACPACNTVIGKKTPGYRPRRVPAYRGMWALDVVTGKS